MHWVLYRLQNTGSTSVAVDCIENTVRAFTCPPHSVSVPANLVAKLDYFWKRLNHMARVAMIGDFRKVILRGLGRLTEVLGPLAIAQVLVVLSVMALTHITTIIMTTRAP
jgi:hypothetical protein